MHLDVWELYTLKSDQWQDSLGLISTKDNSVGLHWPWQIDSDYSEGISPWVGSIPLCSLFKAVFNPNSGYKIYKI